MRVDLTFLFEGKPRTFVGVSGVRFQDYVFNGKLAPEPALIAVRSDHGVETSQTAYELSKVSDIRLTVHRA